MWLSQRAARAEPMKDTASVGDVTMAGEKTGVMLDGERRSIGLNTPGGYLWKPLKDQYVLVVKGLDGENLISGVPRDDMPGELECGEVLIKSEGGMSIKLTNGGDILISGNVIINGNLNVNGENYVFCHC